MISVKSLEYVRNSLSEYKMQLNELVSRKNAVEIEIDVTIKKINSYRRATPSYGDILRSSSYNHNKEITISELNNSIDMLEAEKTDILSSIDVIQNKISELNDIINEDNEILESIQDKVNSEHDIINQFVCDTIKPLSNRLEFVIRIADKDIRRAKTELTAIMKDIDKYSEENSFKCEQSS